MKPSPSSAVRIAPTRPSIMSDGAMTSTPARAYVSAVFANSSSGAIVVDVAVVVDDPAVAVIGVLAVAQVGDHQQLRQRVLDRARRALHDAVGIVVAGRVRRP